MAAILITVDSINKLEIWLAIGEESIYGERNELQQNTNKHRDHREIRTYKFITRISLDCKNQGWEI